MKRPGGREGSHAMNYGQAKDEEPE
jgi:hypothetical protein